MAKETSQAQKEGFVASMMEKNLDRFQSMMDEMVKVEEKAMTQSHKNLDDATTMFKAGIDYTSDLSAQWRALVVDGTQKTMELMTWGK